MKRRSIYIWRLSAVLLGAGLAAAVGQSCMRRMEPGSETLASGAGGAQTIVRVFRKVIGRDPGPSEIAALKNLDYPSLVKTVVASKQFDEEGFFNLHRERLLLNREGTESWVKNSYRDYCALKLEMTEAATNDRASPGGYFDLLRYTDRWVPVGNVPMEKCFFGSSIDDIIKAAGLYGIGDENQDNGGGGNGGEGDPQNPPVEPAAQPPAPVTAREKAARSCVRNIAFEFSDNWETSPQEAKAFVEQLKALPAADREKSLLEVPVGEVLFTNKVRRNLIPNEFDWPASAPPVAELQITLAKEGGRVQMLQEFGQNGNGMCQFTVADPITYSRASFDDFGGDEPIFDDPPADDDNTDDNTDDNSADPLVGLPVDLGPPIGVPENPMIVPADQPATGAGGADGAGAGLNLADQPPIGRLYMKIRMPKQVMGIHASPYWLSRHTSKAKNRNLHRARLMYFSYFCADINPDAANFSGAPLQDFPDELKPYFSADDNHTKGSQNCYNCHTKVQPIANFFGLSSWGSAYDFNTGGEDGFFDPAGWPVFYASNRGFDRPGGIYDGTKFFDAPGSNKGLEGLANVMSAYPEARRCIVEGTWAAMVGRDYPLFDGEREAAIKAFGNGGTPRLSKLVSHLATENQRGVAFFTKGENEMAKIKAEEVFACPESLTEAISNKAQTTMGSACSNCHAGEFINSDNKFDFDNYFTEGNDDDTPKIRGELWHKLYCKIKGKRMPPANSGINLDDTTRGNVWCFLEKTRDDLAAAGKIPAEYKGKECPGAPAPANAAGGAHAVTGGGN